MHVNYCGCDIRIQSVIDGKHFSNTQPQKTRCFLVTEACTSMTHLSISGLMQSLFLSVSLLVIAWTWQQTNGSVSSLPLHACACTSNTVCTMPQNFSFNDKIFPRFPPASCLECRRTSGADLTSKQAWARSGGMGLGVAGFKRPGNWSPKTAPNHHVNMDHRRRASASVDRP